MDWIYTTLFYALKELYIQPIIYSHYIHPGGTTATIFITNNNMK